MKIQTRRAILLANAFNFIVGLYFIIIAIVSLIKLRWYHQITITVRMRHMFALTSTSYFSFVILIAIGLLLITIFIASLLTYSARIYISPKNQPPIVEAKVHNKINDSKIIASNIGSDDGSRQTTSPEHVPISSATIRIVPDHRAYRVHNSVMPTESDSQIYCWTFWHLMASLGLIVILTVWLANRGELVRQAISNQLEHTYSKYEFTNRTNYYSVLIDGMQDINNCCGQFDFSDFPHLGSTGLSYGHYPGSCCGKNIFGSNARVICKPDEIIFSHQTVSIMID